jgi:serine/threonine protein kinase
LICKSVHPHFATTLFPVEKDVYERFSTAQDAPSGLLTYHGIHTSIPSGLILELAENGNLQDWLDGAAAQPPSEDLVYKWISQAAEALSFAHNLGILHSDIHPLNFFLTSSLDLKVGDWGGASVDGSLSYCSYRYKYRLFTSNGTDIAKECGISAATEIFAFGMTVFVMVSGQEVWPELEESRDWEEIRDRISTRRFPRTKDLRVLGSVVEGCWNGRFSSMEEVRVAVERERDTSRERDVAELQQVPFTAK